MEDISEKEDDQDDELEPSARFPAERSVAHQQENVRAQTQVDNSVEVDNEEENYTTPTPKMPVVGRLDLTFN